MNFNFEKARYLMVENQLRPNKIKDPVILDLFTKTKKEDFLSADIKKLAYSDMDISLDTTRGYLKNLHIAQLIQHANIQKHYKILHIGGLTGYVSVMLACLCKKLIVIENKIELIKKFEQNIKKLNFNNIVICNYEFNKGYLNESPYDLIFIDNPIRKLPNLIKEQIKLNSGNLIMIEKINKYLCHAQKIYKNKNNFTNEYLFDVFTRYELYDHEMEFSF